MHSPNWGYVSIGKHVHLPEREIQFLEREARDYLKKIAKKAKRSGYDLVKGDYIMTT